MVAKEGEKQTFTVKGVSFVMIPVKGGTFQMGATSEQKKPESDEKPVHSVTLSNYSIGETEVTQALWQAVMGKNPSNFKGPNRPVETVSWNDCQTFIQKLNALTGKNFRLPTEAEWEYAARGGSKSRGYQYAGSDNLGTVAWYTDNSGSIQLLCYNESARACVGLPPRVPRGQLGRQWQVLPLGLSAHLHAVDSVQHPRLAFGSLVLLPKK
jgi:formylglycine-generating enzyme required for sulfatase activity